jgi:hypothetical protein
LRPLDEPIPPEEDLYRSVADGEFDGDALDPTSIDLPASSVSRAKYVARPEDALKGDDTGIAVTTLGRLPSQKRSPGSVVHEIEVADDPIEGNDPHAEIRVRRQGRSYDPRYRIESKPFKLELRSAIAASFKRVPPTRPPEQASE